MHKILIVDDEKAIVMILEVYLARNGFKVVTASGGREAIDILKANDDIDLMILDKRMPEVSGIDVLRAVRAMGKDIPILLFSGELNIDREKQEELLNMGFSSESIINKPVELSVILGAVKRKLNIA
jgi:CheY-like chemotaxis protein